MFKAVQCHAFKNQANKGISGLEHTYFCPSFHSHLVSQQICSARHTPENLPVIKYSYLSNISMNVKSTTKHIIDVQSTRAPNVVPTLVCQEPSIY